MQGAISRAFVLSASLCLLLFAALPSARAQSPLPPLASPSPPPPPTADASSGHTLKSESDLVVLHVTVTNRRGQFVPNLTMNNFEVYEDKVRQTVSLFSRADIPVTMGLVIDNSGSMREKRPEVNAAALTFVKTSNPDDEAFVVNFNDEYYLDTPGNFTNNFKSLQEALSRITTRGSTALYDAVIASLNHIKKGHKDKRVLLLITDGDDDASRHTFADAIRAAQQSTATIYAIGVYSQDDREHDRGMVRRSTKVLKELAQATGGKAYFPKDLMQVTPICEQVAREIRNQYTLGYYPTDDKKDGTFRKVEVKVKAPKRFGKLDVRTRTGYYAPKSSSAN